MKRILLPILAVLMLLPAIFGCSRGENMKVEKFELTPTEGQGKWTVGFGQVELQLPESENPFYIAGYNNGLEITGVLDLQRATAVWLDCGEGGVLLIGIDCVGLSKKCVDDIRTDIAAECAEWGCESVNIYATHTHAGIDTLGLWGPVATDGKNPEFTDVLVKAAAEAARLAYADRREGRLTYSTADTSALNNGSPIQRDSRNPKVYDPLIHQLRFIPDNAGGGVRIISYAAHAEALRSENTLVSRDYPGVMADVIKAECGDDVLFMPAAVGGLIMTEDIREDKAAETMADNMRRTGEFLASAVLNGCEREEELSPCLSGARTEFAIPLDNTVFMYYKFLGILENKAIPGEGATGYDLESELTVLNIGGLPLVLIPGEIFPELVHGSAGYRLEVQTLGDIAVGKGFGQMMLCGLANDELGYIIPAQDFMVSENAPYLELCVDESGEDHYEETNSVGPRTYERIAEAFASVLAALE